MSKEKKQVSFMKIFLLICYFYFLAGIYFFINLFVIKFYPQEFTFWSFLIESIAFVGALAVFIDILPKDYVFKKPKIKNENSKK